MNSERSLKIWREALLSLVMCLTLLILVGLPTAVNDNRWQLISPGGGGGVTSIAAGPVTWTEDSFKNDDGVVLVSSDVGGVRISNNESDTFVGFNKGLKF